MARGLAAIRMIVRTSFFVTVAADSPRKSLEDIAGAASAGPGQLNDDSRFVGRPGHPGAGQRRERWERSVDGA